MKRSSHPSFPSSSFLGERGDVQPALSAEALENLAARFPSLLEGEALLPAPPAYKDEIDVLEQHNVHFSRIAPAGGVKATTLLLWARPHCNVLFIGIKDRRADFTRLRKRLGCAHLRLAPRFAVKDLLLRPPAALSPMALAFYEFEPFIVVADKTMLASPTLGFAVGGGQTLWFSSDALWDLVPELGFPFRIINCAPRGVPQ